MTMENGEKYVKWPAEKIEKKIDLLTNKVDTLTSKVDTVYTTVVGIPETQNGGLVGAVKNLRCDHENLKTRFWLLLVALAASGVLGISIWKIIAS